MQKYSKQEFLDMCPENIQQSDLNDSTKVIIGALINAENTYSQHNENKGYFHIANSTLADLTELSTPTIIKELGRLSNKNMLGLIHRVSGKAHRQSQYSIDWDRLKSYGKAEVKSEVNTSETLVKPNPSLELTNTLPIEYSIIEDRIKKIEERIENLEKIENNNNIILNNIYNILNLNFNSFFNFNNNNNIQNIDKKLTSSTTSDEVEEDIIKKYTIPSMVNVSGFTAPTVLPSFNYSNNEVKDPSEGQEMPFKSLQVEDEEDLRIKRLTAFRDKMLAIPSGVDRLEWCMKEWKKHNEKWKQEKEYTIKANCEGFREWLESGMKLTAFQAIELHENPIDDTISLGEEVNIFEGWE